MRFDIQTFNANRIKETIEWKTGSKMIARGMPIGQSQLTKLKAEDVGVASTKAEVLGEVDSFYRQLYKLDR